MYPICVQWWQSGGWLEWGRLANFAPDDLVELEEWEFEYLMDLKFDPRLLRALWELSDLPFPTHHEEQHT